jgi:hypothetical protein
MKPNSNFLIGVTPVKVILANPNRTAFAIANMSGAATIYVGTDANVTTSDGFPIRPGTQMTWNNGNGDNCPIERFVVSSLASTDIRVLEEFTGGD